MSVALIKTVGLLAMLVDHIGVFLFPENLLLRILGRMAMPIFAWAAVIGFEKTRNFERYVLRLLSFGLVGQVPYVLFFGFDSGLNIMFTLALGLLLVLCLSKVDRVFFRSVILIVFCALAEILRVEYGALGVGSLAVIYIARERYLVMSALLAVVYIVGAIWKGHENVLFLWQPVGVMSVLLFAFYNGKRGANLKYWFYVFYPLHLIVLGAIWNLLYLFRL